MKGFFYLVGGSTLAQFVTIVLSPILSRIYLPEDFGLFGFISSLIYFVNSFSLMRLEIELLKNKYTKIEIYQYGMAVLLFTTLVSFIVVLALNLNYYYYSIPFLVFLSGYYNLLFYNLLSSNNIKNINTNKIILSTVIGGSQLIFGFIGLTKIGLILGHIFGFIVTLLFMEHKFFGLKCKGFVNKFHKNIFIESPSMALNVLSNHGPTSLIFLLLGGVFGGAYFMAFRILILPINIISTSLYNYIGANFYIWGRDFQEKQKYLLEKLIIFTFIPVLFIYLLIEKLVLMFLGPQWIETAIIAKLSISWLYIRFFFDGFFINFSLLDKPHFNLIFQIISLVTRSISIIIPFYLGFSPLEVITIFCLISLVIYLLGIFLIFNILEIKSNIFNILILFFVLIMVYLILGAWS